MGFKGSGEVTASDYENVLIPAVETALKKTKRIRLLYVLDEDFQGFTAGAVWEDTKVGLKHLTRFERIAVVSNTEWIRDSVKVFGFAIPGEIRVYEYDHLPQAHIWVSAPPSKGNLEFEYLEEQVVLILRPDGELDIVDFKRVSQEVDPRIDALGALNGVMIVAEHFPGWDDPGAYFAHMQFVKDHRKMSSDLPV